jgi:hypothetical protein
LRSDSKRQIVFLYNYEIDKRSDLGSNFVANNGDGVTGVNESRVLESDWQYLLSFK